jgi:hypothetical protein
MQSLVLETRDLRSEMASEARGLRSEPVSGAQVSKSEGHDNRSPPCTMHGSSHSGFTPMQPNAATQSSFAPAASQAASSHAMPTFPAWTQRPMPELQWSPLQNAPLRYEDNQPVDLRTHARPVEQMATPLETLVRHLGGQASGPVMRSPVLSASRAGLPRPHAQRASPMALTTPGLM